MSLCWWHHRLLHEGGWTIAGRPGEDLRFIRPDGLPIPARPPRLRDDVRRRILGPCESADDEVSHDPLSPTGSEGGPIDDPRARGP